MPKETQKSPMDISMRIAAALASTSMPKEPQGASEFDAEKHVQAGHVPPHLQHLHNLIDDLDKEREALVRALIDKMQERSTARNLFFAALATTNPTPQDCTGTEICEGWQIAGIKKDADHHSGGNILDNIFGDLDRVEKMVRRRREMHA